MTLAHFTRPDLIVPRLSGDDAAGVLQELSLRLHQAGFAANWLPVCNDALNREFLLGTEVASSLVFPYAHAPRLDQPVFAFGRSDHAVDWRPRRLVPARLVLLTAVPEMDSDDFYRLTSGLARLASNASLLRRILIAPDAGAIFDIFAGQRVATAPALATARQPG